MASHFEARRHHHDGGGYSLLTTAGSRDNLNHHGNDSRKRTWRMEVPGLP
eukprot:CAMPEP_0172458318 /NCGR_PEP_ID=MMETSP1065-20121228/27051_1 /TAXON_ID=265537 /ORGANISM="Amphiprora paludosa, Strain CCMP125" /LENGTH=49 /DNA_ID= /DNA_START= /DNA_END= /DNA_ORIENTATION=